MTVPSYAPSANDAPGWNRQGLRPELAHALERLTTLHEGFAGVGAVIAAGLEAVPALKAILHHTESSGLFEVRSRAIAALSGLGADDVLIDFIGHIRPVADPVARAGEEAALSLAARALAVSQDPRAFPALLRLAKRQPLPGAIAALAAARRTEAIPGLIRGLDEDDTRRAAAAGLVALGRSSRSALLAIAKVAAETVSEKRRRRAAMAALADIGLAAWQRDDIGRLIDEPDAEFSLHACRALMRSGADPAPCRARLAALAPGLRPPLSDLAMQLLAPPAVAAVTAPPTAPTSAPRSPRRPILHLGGGSGRPESAAR